MTASLADQEIWHVLLAFDDMKRMNVDQLDDAFRLSLVDASTMVWKAGMQTWRRLGSLAGLDEELETIARPALSPRPLPAARSLPPSPPPPPRPAPRTPIGGVASPFAVSAANPFAATAPASPFTTRTPVYAAPLVAPVRSAPAAVDPYVLPKRRVAIPSEVDFRRGSRGLRVGRWFGALLLLSVGVLAAYRQNWLREGARRVGLENKYLAGERRVTGFVSARAPAQLRGALTRLALLPGPNALPMTSTSTATTTSATTTSAAAATSTTASGAVSEPGLKTVALESLPVLNVDAASAQRSSGPLAHQKPLPPREVAPVKSRSKPADSGARAAGRVQLEEEPAAAPAPVKQAVASVPPASANDSPLKAAIRQAILADAAKK